MQAGISCFFFLFPFSSVFLRKASIPRKCGVITASWHVGENHLAVSQVDCLRSMRLVLHASDVSTEREPRVYKFSYRMDGSNGRALMPCCCTSGETWTKIKMIPSEASTT